MICSACVVRLRRFHGKKGFLQETDENVGLLFYGEMGSQAKKVSLIFFAFIASGGKLFANSSKKYAKNAAKNKRFLDFLPGV